MKFKRKKLRDFREIKFNLFSGGGLGSIDFSDAFGGLISSKKNLYLGRFSVDDLTAIMDRVGITAYLESRGFGALGISISRDESRIHYMKLFSGEQKPENLLLDLRLAESKFMPDRKFFPQGEPPVYDMVVIEWLSAQNSRSDSFDARRPQLPGQEKPGLGILKYCLDMMFIVAREITRDGFMDVPEHLHSAIMYSRRFKFFDPVKEGVLRALMRDLKNYSLSDLSWGMITHTIIDVYKEKPLVYVPSEQIFYVSRRMRDYFHSREYKRVFRKYYKIKKYRLDYEEMVKRRREILAKKKLADL